MPRAKIAEFCRRNHIQKLALFGSALRPAFGPDSDGDVLVESGPGTHVGFFELYDLEQELSRVFGGRKVDLNTSRCLSEHFREEVLAEAEIAYVET